MEGVKRRCAHEWDYTKYRHYYRCMNCGDIGAEVFKGRDKGKVKRLSSSIQDDVKRRIAEAG